MSLLPELPDIACYLHALEPRVTGRVLLGIRLGTPFILRSTSPGIAEVDGKRVLGLRRMGKRIVFVVEGGCFVILHLMIAGRLHWKPPGATLGSKNALVALDFDDGSLVLTEAGSKRRASLYLARGEEALRVHDRGGIEPLEADLNAFQEALRRENHTLKTSLTDPRLFSGIGNTYSDEILHRARLSPVKLTFRLTDEEIERLYDATRAVLMDWCERLIRETGDGFPEKVTAFREGMAVHGRYGQPCPECGSPVQRIVHGERECNYCPHCQTDGKLLADRALSRLLRSDWPRTLEEMEERITTQRAVAAGVPESARRDQPRSTG